MAKQPLLIIEHCEPALSEWLMLEYRHAAKLWSGDLLFTRVADKKTMQVLKKIGRCERKKAHEVFSTQRCIVLDPQAQSPLTPKDCTHCDAVIVGGLLGYEKPQGRTKKMITDTTSFQTRHLGPLQLSIDGAVFVVKAICMGLRLQDIEIANEIEIIHDSVHSTILPFGYPLIDDVPMVTPGLVEYLIKK